MKPIFSPPIATQQCGRVLEARGIKVVATEAFQGGDTDFSEQLTRIQALAPDAIFVSSQPPEKPDILIQGHALGISAPFIVRTLTEANVQAAGAAAEGAMTFTGWGAAIDTPQNQAFVENYTTQFGIAPTNFAARAYAAFHILAEAIQEGTLNRCCSDSRRACKYQRF